VHDAWRYLYAVNPMVGILDGFRWSLIGGPAPGVEDLVSLVVGLLLLVGGGVYFHSVERRLVDRI
jgi:lipopolysaccharide transport system permease protein